MAPEKGPPPKDVWLIQLCDTADVSQERAGFMLRWRTIHGNMGCDFRANLLLEPDSKVFCKLYGCNTLGARCGRHMSKRQEHCTTRCCAARDHMQRWQLHGPCHSGSAAAQRSLSLQLPHLSNKEAGQSRLGLHMAAAEQLTCSRQWGWPPSGTGTA